MSGSITAIDAVIPWVNGADPAWLDELKKYVKPTVGEDCRKNRFRDWELLHFLFRSIELYAPWIRTIHFVTWGHLPEWLNTHHPQLNIVNHKDYIPEKYLPVFSSHPIELNLHRIEGLAEQFIYFNDDTFLSKPLKPGDFFQSGLPCDMAIMNAVSGGDIASIIMNNLNILNKKFRKYDVLKKRPVQWYNFKYGSKVMRNLLLLPWPKFTGFFEPHQPQSFLKRTLEDVWNNCEEEMIRTCSNRTRSLSDVNQYLFRYWQYANGDFIPYKRNGKLFFLKEKELDEIRAAFFSKKYHTLCLNDMSQTSENFDLMKSRLTEILECVFPEKSHFEKQGE